MEMQIVTQAEKAKLEQELKAMIDRRPIIANAIAEAREKGDLKENADYHAARDEYALNESRIKNMEQRVKNVTVVDSSSVPEGMVFLGSIVKVKEVDSDDTETFRIVGEVGKLNLDSDILEVSAKSPLGEALVRARVGETVTVHLAKATVKYEILELLEERVRIAPLIGEAGIMLESETVGPAVIEGEGAAPSFEDAMAAAFPPLDATEETVAELANVAPDAHLLEATPTRAEVDYEKLEEEVARTRVIFLRGAAAIPLTAIVAIGGALLIHFLFVGGFLLALWLAVTKPGGFGEGPVLQEGGGPTSGMMVSGDGPQGDPAIDASVKDILLHSGAKPMTAVSELPRETDLTEAPQQIAAANLESSPADSPLIGIPSGNDPMGMPKPHALPPRVSVVVPPRDTGVVVVPPSHDPQSTKPTQVASTGSQTQSPSSPKGGVGSGGDADYGEEPVIQLSKGDPGSGSNSGHQGGGGIDRGSSGANQPEPQILEWDFPKFSETVQLNRPPQSTKCKVLVLASGRAGKIDIVQSCGQPALDQMLVDALQKAKFRPAYRNGRPYDADKDVELKYGNE